MKLGFQTIQALNSASYVNVGLAKQQKQLIRFCFCEHFNLMKISPGIIELSPEKVISTPTRVALTNHVN